jgi:hypothetical protein
MPGMFQVSARRLTTLAWPHYIGRSGTMICGVPSAGIVVVTEGIAGVTSGGVVDAGVLNDPDLPAPIDDRLFIWFGYRVPADGFNGEPKRVDRLEGGEPTGPVKVGVELLMGGAGSNSGGNPPLAMAPWPIAPPCPPPPRANAPVVISVANTNAVPSRSIVMDASIFSKSPCPESSELPESRPDRNCGDRPGSRIIERPAPAVRC